MIKYQLKCANDHSFESWFASYEACAKLMSAGMVSCTTCGSSEVSKSLMAPAVAAKGNIADIAVPAPSALDKMRQEVEANSDYVGMSFATEARDMHDGITPERAIYGEAKPEDAKKLLEDGIPVVPLPFMPSKKVN